MIITKEFTVLLEDRPSALGKVCRALANREVNILALQSFPIGGKNVTRFIVDDPKKAKTVLVAEGLTFTEEQIVHVRIPRARGKSLNSASRMAIVTLITAIPAPESRMHPLRRDLPTPIDP